MNSRLFVGNLSFNTSEEAIRDAFAEFGEIVEAKLVTDRDTGRSRGFAFVELTSNEAAQKAIQEMNGALLDGRPLRVNLAEARRDSRGGGGGGGGGFSRSRGGGGGGDRSSRGSERRNRW